MTLLLSEGMLYSSFAFHCIFWAHILFDSCHFVIYMLWLKLELLWLLNFALRLSLQFTSVIFMSKLWFGRFLVLASESGFSTSPESCTSVQSREKLHVHLEKRLEVVFGFVDSDSSFERMIKRSMLMASVTITKSRFDSKLIPRLGNLSECARIPNYMRFLKFGNFRPALFTLQTTSLPGLFPFKNIYNF